MLIVGAVLIEAPAAQALTDMGGSQLGLLIGCAGDCNGDGQVAINELVTAVGIALGNTPLSSCAAADISGNGFVEISELITAVGFALNGCPAATPTPTPTPVGTGCPVSFQDDSVNQHLICVYAGSWNASCGSNTLQVGFQSDGTTFAAVLGTNPQIGLLGNATLPRTATLAAWYYFTNPSDLRPFSGMARASLSADGRTLEIALKIAPFSIDDSAGHPCDFTDYQGTFIGIVQGSGAQQTAAQELMPLMSHQLMRP